MARPMSVIATYRPREGQEAAFYRLLKRHWPAMKEAGLVTRGRPRIWKARDKRTGRKYFVEMFAWKDARASDKAHETPEVLAVWGPMEPLLASMDIAVVEQVALTARK